MKASRSVRWIDEINKDDVELGGKAANLGELYRLGMPVPWAFVVTADAYARFVQESGIAAEMDRTLMDIGMDENDLLEKTSRVKEIVSKTPLPEDVVAEITESYCRLSARKGTDDAFVAVRSSATSEDSKDASSAGQQDTYLNVRGRAEVVEAVRKCWASLYTPRAVSYRRSQGLDRSGIGISVVVQEMVDADASGVAFTAHPVTNEEDQIVIEASYGLGELVVSGRITPDRFVVAKNEMTVLERNISEKEIMLVRDSSTGKSIERRVNPESVKRASVSDDALLTIARLGKKIEGHYGFPQDIEWATKGDSFYILQSRPITTLKSVEKNMDKTTGESKKGEVLLRGLGVSPGLGVGRPRVVVGISEARALIKKGDILVTKMTNPDWVPYMRIVSGIVTDEGGMTCHAAIVSRELGTPCIVGSREATRIFNKHEDTTVTVDGGLGIVYSGDTTEKKSKYDVKAVLESQPITATKVYVNLSIPDLAEKIASETQADGVGLLRAEHLLLSVGKHPRRLVEEGGAENMVNAFAEGIRKVAQAFYPRPVVYRFLDFKPDEFLGLEGGEVEKEMGHLGPNPLIGYRGAFRYRKEPEIFRLECRAIKEVREKHGLKNVHAMIPFVRTTEDITETYALMREEGLQRSKDFKLWIMVEVPSAGIIIDKMIESGIDGVSFGTNDFTMTILGADRDDASIQEIYDERNLAVLRLIAHVIRACRNSNVTTSICGQAPSVYPEYCEFMVREGATSISVNPDAVISARRQVAAIEQKIILERSLRMTDKGDTWELQKQP